MKSVTVVAVLLGVAFLTGLVLTLISRKPVQITTAPVTREFTLGGLSTVPTGTTAATILGSIGINGTIPAGSTINVEARLAGTQQFSTVLQNIPAISSQTFSYTKATRGATYDMKVTLLDGASKVIGSSQAFTVTAPALDLQFNIDAVNPPATPTPTPEPTLPTTPGAVTPTPAPTPTPALTSLSGTVGFHGVVPVNTRIVILQKLANASSYQVAVDNLTPGEGTVWQWDSPIPGNSYSLIAVLKQKRPDGSDTDFAYSAPVTVTAPAVSIALTITFNYTLPKPSDISTVTCTTYNSGPNENSWNVTVNFPTYSGAQSYWLQVGTTDGGSDIANTYGSATTVATVFKNNTSYFARYAYSAVLGADTGSGQYSVFSDSTRLICSK